MQQVRIQIRKEIINGVYFPLLVCNSRFMVLYGGAGSGKSVFAAQKILLRCLAEPGHRVLITRKVARTIRASQYQLLKDLISDYNLHSVCRQFDGEMRVRFTNGSEIVAAGLDDIEKLKSIAGITMIWIEEATELSPADLEQLNLRLRGSAIRYFQIILTFNPIDDQHWLRNRFFLDYPVCDRSHPPPTHPREFNKVCTILKTTWLDNQFIDKAFAAQLDDLKEQNPVLYQIYALGEWAVPTDMIYPNWRTIALFPDNTSEECYGLDFGFNAPTALVRVAWADDRRMIVEEHLYQTKLLTNDLIVILKEIIPNARTPIYADGAEPSRIEELYRAGFNIHAADKAPGSVRDGIDFCQRFAIEVVAGSANLQREIKAYVWKKDRMGVVLDAPVKFNDHLMDAMRYAAYTHGKKYLGTPMLKLPSVGVVRKQKNNRYPGY